MNSTAMKIEELDELLAQILPMLNAISASAWHVAEGNLKHSKHREVSAKLERWILRNRGVLPDALVNLAAGLNLRLFEWATSNGSTATPADFAKEFGVLQGELSKCKNKLLGEMDERDANHSRGVVIHNYGDAHVGDKYTTSISNSNVGAAAVGKRSTATGSVAPAAQAPSQEQHRKAVGEAQSALVRDQDALDRLGSGVFEALSQFLRLARQIEVEQKSMAEVQGRMKETLDEVWAKQVAEGMKPQVIPRTLEFASALTTNPIMAEVAKKLIGA